MKLNKFPFFIFYFLLIGCKTSNKFTKIIKINQNQAAKIINDKPVLIMSCIKCGCFIDVINDFEIKNPTLFNSYAFLTDKTCVSGLKNVERFQQLNKATLDSLFEENYNVILVKRKNNDFESLLIETEGSKKFEKILLDFLK